MSSESFPLSRNDAELQRAIDIHKQHATTLRREFEAAKGLPEAQRSLVLATLHEGNLASDEQLLAERRSEQLRAGLTLLSFGRTINYL